VTDCEGQTIVEASVVQFSVLYVNTVCCCLEFVVGNCHGQSLLDRCGVLSWSAE
jgi:hypothetical protein